MKEQEIHNFFHLCGWLLQDTYIEALSGSQIPV